jgi:Oxygenase domain of the 2OGFeDO superfamily
VKILHCAKRYACELGTFCDQSDYDILVTEDTVCYGPSAPENGNDGIVFKLLKQPFTEGEQRLAYEALRAAAVETHNRGHAAGPIGGRLNGCEWVTPDQIEILLRLIGRDEAIFEKRGEETQGCGWKRSPVIAEWQKYDGWFDRWHNWIITLSPLEQRKAAEHVIRNYISSTTYAMPVMSGVAGYMDRYPRIPYGRATSYTEKHPYRFAKCSSYIRKLDAIFKRELPSRWKAQREAANIVDPRFLICGSVFSTLTVNYNWQTYAHRDGGDLSVGFSSLAGFTGPDGKGWRGGEFILPEYRIAVKLEPRDLLLVASHEAIHANAPLLGEDNDRLTVVAYFREKMLKLGSWEYEMLRKRFVTGQGLWEGMWRSQAWADYLAEHNMVDEDGLV